MFYWLLLYTTDNRWFPSAIDKAALVLAGAIYSYAAGKNGDAFFTRGMAKIKLGDKNGACLDWKEAGENGNIQAAGMINKYCK